MDRIPSEENRNGALPAEPSGGTPEDPVLERMDLAAADVNWKAREAERKAAGGESDAERRRRRQIARLVRRIGGWLSGCFPANDEDERQGCSRCEYRAKVLENENDGTVGCEGIEEAMVPLMMLEELRELLKLVREDVTK